MLPTLTSSRSYTQQQRKPDGRRQPVARSSSFLGTIKNIVTAPLSWFAQDDDDFEDTPGKRRRSGQANEAGAVTDEGEKRIKRMRIDSPEGQRQPGYLDPPRQIFQQPHSAPPGVSSFQPPRLTTYTASINRSTSVAVASHSVQRQQPRNNRHTVSPLRTSFGQADIMSRTMSMDPPARLFPTRELTVNTSRDRTRYSMPTAHEGSTSPSRSPFRMRTSLTPQPSGPNFGPSVPQRREHTEPPTLEELMANPMFVRPPPEQNHLRNEAGDSKVTLGSLVDSQRSNRPPVRQHSSLLFGGSQGSDGRSNLRAANAAEKALHELDIYKTPLLPTRLRGSSTIPDMFKPKPKRSSTPILMHSDQDEKPRLGRSKGKDTVNGTKPYAGEGGMKKMLARRRLEEDEERKLEQAEAMDDDHAAEEAQKPVDEGPQKQATEQHQQQALPPAVPPIPKFDSSFDRNASREQSSLRVGRTRTSRMHISRPTSRPHNRFSAAYDEEESDDQMLEEKSTDQIVLEEAAKKIPMFTVPAGFSFAKETPVIQHDHSKAKEPPMTALPFSLIQSTTVTVGGPTTTSPSRAPVVAASEAQDSAIPSFFAQPPTPSNTLQPPSISFTAATPEQSKATFAEVPKMASGVPNFFANSPAFSNPITVAPPATTGSDIPNFFGNLGTSSKPVAPEASITTSAAMPNFFINSSTLSKPMVQPTTPANFSFGSPVHATPTTDAENPLWEGEKVEKPAFDHKPLLFSDRSKSAMPSSLFGGSSNSNTSASGAGSSSTPPIFGLSAPLTSVKEEPVSTPSLFGGMNKTAEPAAATPAPFTFGAPTTSAEVPTPQAPVEAAKPAPLFGSAPVSSFAGFSGPPSTSTNEAPKPAFSFSQPVSNASTVVEAPKPQFATETSGGFLFGQRASSVDPRPSSLSPFSFGAAPATPPAAAEKAAFSFGTSPVTAPPTAPSFSFGPPSGSSNGTDVSHRPFAFGNAAATPVRPITPPSNDQEFKMEESPTRELNGRTETPKPALGGFSFGALSATTSSASIFGQNNPSSQAGSAPFSFGSVQTTTSNPFASKTEEKAEPQGFGFGQIQKTPSSGFSFGQKSAEATSTTPISTSGFSFGQQPVAPPPIATSNSFGFGAPSNPNPFSQTVSNPGTAPNSPSTFNQPTPFAFASPTAASNPFAFGSSQPASPATNGNLNLPQVPGTPSGGGFSFGGGNSSQTTSPFQATAPSLPPVGGGLFTIGSAPPPPTGGGGRTIKKLPNRRGGGLKR